MIPTTLTPHRYRTTNDLTLSQRWVVRVMAENQFGRIENLRVTGGQPVPDENLRIVRVARLGGARAEASPSDEREDFELKRAIGDLFDELSRLGNGLVNRLEFRHGLPFQIEMTTYGPSDGERGGSKADKSSDPVADVSSRQPCATNEAANSTLLTPLSATLSQISADHYVPPSCLESSKSVK